MSSSAPAAFTGSLVEARTLCHLACQWPSMAARANLTAAADDSHSNLGWNEAHRALVSRRLSSESRLQVGFGFADCALMWMEDGTVSEHLALVDTTPGDAQRWMDRLLAAAGLKGSSHADMPYELNGVASYSALAGLAPEVAALGERFGAAHSAYERLIPAFVDLSIKPLEARCWPHHFDLGTLFPLEEGDPETARSIGVGLSPGDGTYPEPYFYCTPWPVPEAAGRPAPPSPWFWHTDGFVSMVCLSSAVDELMDIDVLLSQPMRLSKEILKA